MSVETVFIQLLLDYFLTVRFSRFLQIFNWLFKLLLNSPKSGLCHVLTMMFIRGNVQRYLFYLLYIVFMVNCKNQLSINDCGFANLSVVGVTDMLFHCSMSTWSSWIKHKCSLPMRVFQVTLVWRTPQVKDVGVQV